MITHATTDVSVPDELVMVKDVPTTLADTCRNPGAPPGDCVVRKIRELAAMDVFATVAAPATSVATPIAKLVPSVTRRPSPAWMGPGEATPRRSIA